MAGWNLFVITKGKTLNTLSSNSLLLKWEPKWLSRTETEKPMVIKCYMSVLGEVGWLRMSFWREQAIEASCQDCVRVGYAILFQERITEVLAFGAGEMLGVAEHVMLLQGTRVQSPALTAGGAHLPRTPAPRYLSPSSDFWRHCTQMHITMHSYACTHIRETILKQTKEK